jgi:hypothetical protein
MPVQHAEWPHENPPSGPGAPKTVRSKFYEHSLIQEAVNQVFFKHKRALGVIYDSWFSPFPLQALALIANTVRTILNPPTRLLTMTFVTDRILSRRMGCWILPEEKAQRHP